ncbi:septation protein SepH [Corynebacterium halotolerans]|uniref:DUF3071 domain-containing protein n=1 Tax=Corynebacterium halotolerans YIM 70093 = DSM 44683 TaxID=1121362 RepID=M1P587_9CORY|nr:septation protein SepH [Corynebacterium halotolerans]AGF71831.1 hypothetical protein A605_04100 [Corynebacterium halotolerans YIM 70093 = DSM 44683]
MRELFLVNSESTETSLVLRAEDGEQFFVAVDDTLREALTGTSPVPRDEPQQSTGRPGPRETEPVPEPTEPATSAEVTPDASDAEPSAAPAAPAAPTGGTPSAGLVERGLPTPDPRLTAPLSLRPREIQERIRGGASVEELAEKMGVMESRVDAFAHPVLLERERIAQLARQAHPVREDGPAKLTLWEMLATAFAARGHNLADAEWDAYKEPGSQWVVRVSWTAGLSENSAEWTYHHSTSSPTAEARNAVAADLTDPDFIQPVRTLTSVGRGARYAEDLDEDYEDYEEHEDDEVHPTHPRDDAPDRDDRATPAEDTGPTADDGGEAPAPKSTDRTEGGDVEEQPQKSPAKRRRKAVTPHWEDVLLGVRTNTKRPRN